MKRVLSQLLLFLFVSVMILEPSGVFANDGSLHINTDINQNKETKEVYYIEQEAELSKLFNPEMTEQIVQQQAVDLQDEKRFNDIIFLEKLTQTDWSSDYRQLLFDPETALSVSSDYGVQLVEKKAGLSWQMVALFCLGILVMSWSLYQTRRRKGN